LVPASSEPTHARTAVPGSPAWWSRQAAVTPARGRGRPPRSFDAIVAAAGELVDEIGVTAFSMRALAARLGTSTATLYRHFEGKDELMVHVVDRFLGEVQASAARGRARTWQQAARQRLMGLHEALSAHPNLLPLLVEEVPIGPRALAIREATITELIGFGFTVELAARAYTTLAHYVVGFVAQQHAPGAPGPRQAAELRSYFLGLDPERFPSTVAAADALTTVPPAAEFLEGLQFILDGIDRAVGPALTPAPR
jgi:AcrR family transcriptional regulator